MSLDSAVSPTAAPFDLRPDRVRAGATPGASARRSAESSGPALGHHGRNNMTLGTILLIVLILLLIGAFPSWPYSRGWGYQPTGIIGVVLVVVIVLLLMGTI
jgi:hypothetical protein